VIGAYEAAGRDVVDQASEDDLLAHSIFLCKPGALQHMNCGPEPMLEEIQQRGPFRHARQTRIVPHQMQLAARVNPRQRRSRIALTRGVDRRLHNHQAIHRLAQCVVGSLGLHEHGHGRIIGCPVLGVNRL
jgi:hypothetical protein